MSKREMVKAAAQAVLFAAIAYTMLAIPGFLTDNASTVPVMTQQARQ